MVYIDKMTGKEAYEKLNFARNELEKNREEFEKLNPPNGWGSYKTFLQWINELITICLEYPEGVWDSWR